MIRKIANIISCAILYCDGKGYFKISNVFRLPLSPNTNFFLDITKNVGYTFTLSYHVTLKSGGLTIMETVLDYDVYRKDVPFYQAYILRDTKIYEELDNVVGLKGILEQLNEETRKT